LVLIKKCIVNLLQSTIFLENLVYNDVDYQSVPHEFLSRDELHSEEVRKSSLGLIKRDALNKELESGKHYRLYRG